MPSAAIVSDPSEELILVDSLDNEVGSLSKADCHAGDGVLHRAFSVFLFNSEGQLLLQRRSSDKPLWPLFWSNTCCSHPRVGETLEVAAERRLMQELGIECPLEFVYKFEYHAHFRDVGAEHELCHVFVGRYDGAVNANTTEIAETRLARPDEIDAELASNPEAYTPWFRLEWVQVRDLAVPAGEER